MKKLKIKRKKVEPKVEEKPPFPPARFPTEEEIIKRVDERNSKPPMREFIDSEDMERLTVRRYRENGILDIKTVFRRNGRKKAIERAKMLGQNGGSGGGGYYVFGRPNGIEAELIDLEKNQIVYKELISYARIVDYLTGGNEKKCAQKEKSKPKLKLKVKKKPKLKVKRLKK